jgi:hypothetical protein
MTLLVCTVINVASNTNTPIFEAVIELRVMNMFVTEGNNVYYHYTLGT